MNSVEDPREDDTKEENPGENNRQEKKKHSLKIHGTPKTSQSWRKPYKRAEAKDIERFVSDTDDLGLDSFATKSLKQFGAVKSEDITKMRLLTLCFRLFMKPQLLVASRNVTRIPPALLKSR